MSLSSLFGSTPAQPTPIPTPSSLPNITSAGYGEMAAAARLAGMAGTIATGGGGVTGKASTAKKALTGQ
jgi:hypothetical protein